MIQGQTINVAMNPIAAKQLLPDETFVPAHLELRNGLRTDAGHYRLRPGLVPRWTVSQASPVILLMPVKREAMSCGLVVTADGTVHELFRDGHTVAYLGPTLNGTYRPTWCQFDDLTIICDGQAVIKVNPVGSTTSLLGGNPPAAKFSGVLAEHVILSGYDATGFRWSGPGNAELWPAQNFSNVTGHGERIEFMQVAQTELYFFKTFSLEIWSHVGGQEVFARRGIVTVGDKFSRNRGLAGFSVVMGPGAFYFYCDGDFYVLNGMTAQSISGAYKREIGSLVHTGTIYGFHFAIEHVIRWYAPEDGRCFVFDYVNQVFTEDNLWRDGEWARMPIYAYMELDGRGYAGDYDPTGRVYEWDPQSATDGGIPIRLQRLVRVPLSETQHAARLNHVRLRLTRGTGLPVKATTNLWPGGTFETSLEGWADYQGGTCTRVAAGHESVNALQIISGSVVVPGQNAGGATMQAVPMTLIEGHRYRLQFWSKAISGAPTVRVSVQNGYGDENSLSFSYTPGAEWAQVGQTAYLNGNRAHIYIWSISTVNAMWLMDTIELLDYTNLDRTPVLLARWSFDEQAWSPYVDVPLGEVGERNPYIDLSHPNGCGPLGIGREVRLEFVQSEDVPHLLTAATLTVRELGR